MTVGNWISLDPASLAQSSLRRLEDKATVVQLASPFNVPVAVRVVHGGTETAPNTDCIEFLYISAAEPTEVKAVSKSASVVVGTNSHRVYKVAIKKSEKEGTESVDAEAFRRALKPLIGESGFVSGNVGILEEAIRSRAKEVSLQLASPD